MGYVQATIGTGSESQGGQQQSQGSQPQVPYAFKSFNMSQKEKTLHELVRDSWLSLTTDGDVRLGVKSFLDLRSWFRSNEVPSCQVCNEAGIKAELCKNENCNVRIHHYCLKQLFSQIKAAQVCPSCGTSWPFIIPKAEYVQTEEDNGPTQSQRATGSKGKKRRANTIVEDDEVGCSNQDELNEHKGISSQHPRATTMETIREISVVTTLFTSLLNCFSHRSMELHPWPAMTSDHPHNDSDRDQHLTSLRLLLHHK